jgi:menaquinone-dependent protoporphyrinogen oxidase
MSRMRVLVAAASRHGATTEIAEAIARGLAQRGVEADARPAEGIESIDGYDAVVAGSAVYVGHWLEPARQMIEAHAAALAARPVWLFSSGPLGPPEALKPEGDFRDWDAIDGFAGEIAERLSSPASLRP